MTAPPGGLLQFGQVLANDGPGPVCPGTDESRYMCEPVISSPVHSDLDGVGYTDLEWQVIDFNADGYQDIVYGHEGKWYGHVWHEAAQTLGDAAIIGTYPDIGELDLHVSDYDGDGLADLLFRSPGGAGITAYIALSIADNPVGGDYFAARVGVSTPNPYFPPSLNRRTSVKLNKAVDFSGDGRVDVLVRISDYYVEPGCNDDGGDTYPKPPTNEPIEPFNVNDPIPPLGDDDPTSVRGPIDGPGGPPIRDCRVDEIAWFIYSSEIDPETGHPYLDLWKTLGDDAASDRVVTSASLPTFTDTTLHAADINGDGLADLIYYNGRDDTWYHQLNTGDGFAPAVSFPLVGDLAGQYLKIRDYNGDDLLDLVYPSAYESESAIWRVRKFNWQSGTFSGYEETQATAGCVRARYCANHGGIVGTSLFMDVNGDSKTDQVYISKNYNDGEDNIVATMKLGIGQDDYSNLYRYTPHHVITTITDGFGAVTEIDYGSLAQHAEGFNEASTYRIYDRGPLVGDTSDWGAGSAVYTLTPPHYVVEAVEHSAPTTADPDNVRTVRYFYTGARIQGGGRGFLGFASMASFDTETQVTSKTHYRQDFPYTGRARMTVTCFDAAITFDCNGPGTPDLERTVNTWAATQTAYSGDTQTVAGSHMVWLADAITDSYVAQTDASGWVTNSTLVKSTVTTSSEPDPYGAVPEVSVTVFNGQGVEVMSKTTTNTYDHDVTDWQLARLTDSVVVHTRPNTAPIERTAEFVYDDATGILIEEIVEPDDAPYRLQTDYTLDVFGNRIQTTLTGGGIEGERITRSVFDSLGRFVKQELVRIEGVDKMTSEVLDRDRFGNPTRTINTAGSLIESEYDYMGRLYLTYSPTGAWAITKREPESGLCPQGNAFTVVKRTAGAPTQWTCYDIIGRVQRVFTRSFTGDRHIFTDTRYDEAGRIISVSEPYFSDGPANGATTSAYDVIGRVMRTTSPAATFEGGFTTYTYNGLVTTTKTYVDNPELPPSADVTIQTRTEVKNAFGETVSITDAGGGTLTYAYDAVGNLVETDGPMPGSIDLIVTGYDPYGRTKLWLDDPDSGLWRYDYNAAGELVCQVDAKGQGLRLVYDDLGRKIARYEYEGVTLPPVETPPICQSGLYQGLSVWVYENNAASPAFGQLREVRKGVTGEPWVSHHYSYDGFGRVIETFTKIETGVDTGVLETFTSSTTYDQYSRVFQSFDASGDFAGVTYRYNAQGYLERLEEAAHGEAGLDYRTILDRDAYGHVTWEVLGNGLETLRTYGPAGRLTTLMTGPTGNRIQNWTYAWDTAGNLVQRQDRTGVDWLTEDFTYDGLNRLKLVRLTAPGLGIDEPQVTMSAAYNVGGNITHKSGNGASPYVYGTREAGCADTPGPHALTQTTRFNTTYCYDPNGAQVRTSEGRTVTYNRRHQATVIQAASGLITTFAYGPGGGLAARTEPDGAKTYYLGSVRLRIDAAGNRVWHRTIGGVAIIKRYEATQTDTLAYSHRDHLGSVTALTNAGGTLLERLSYDAWGRRRPAGDWDYGAPPPPNLGAFLAWTRQGFTGHEQVDAAGIIHMGGRLYDPALGRFLSPDPFIQAPHLTQNLNRYTYVLNNPLALTDPTGYAFDSGDWINLVISATIAYVSFGTAAPLGPWQGAAVVASGGFIAGYISTGTTKGALTSAFTAVVFYGAKGGFVAEAGAGASASGGATSTGTVADPSGIAQAEAATTLTQAPAAAHGAGGSGYEIYGTVTLEPIQALQPNVPAASMLVDLAAGAFSSLNAARNSYNWLVAGKNAYGVDIAAGLDRQSLRTAKQRLLQFVGGPARMAQLNEAARIMALAVGAGNVALNASMFAVGGMFARPFGGLTSADGFLFRGFSARAPFNIPVQRFGSMSIRRPDFWGLRIGTSSFANRTFGAIKPAWNPLTQYTTGIIPKGTPLRFGIIGPQGLRYPGGAVQFYVRSRDVVNQTTRLISR